MVLSTVRESGWSVPLAMAEEDMESASESDVDDGPPVHPVPTMQGAFEESMAETMNGDEDDDPTERISKADSVTRRKMLLEQEQYERTVAGRWKQKAGEKFHPLWKLVAQISFGMHLLQQGLAKSDEEVLKILQTHVDEVDGFLERTTEDFDLAQGDINERIRYLKLPLEYANVFDHMLSERNFRVAIVEGNEKIEHIIDRTAAAMNDALKDVQKGLDATRELAKYMTRVDKMWEHRTDEHDSVYLAMIGNTEGWTRAFLTLQSKGGHLRKALVQLGGIVAEMQRRAGAASRKYLVPSRSTTGRYAVDTRSASPQYTATPPRSPNKPLPTAPNPAARIATAHKYSSLSRSASTSPQINQSAASGGIKPALKKDSGVSPRSPYTNLSPRDNHVGFSHRSPDPTRSGRSPTPEKSVRLHDPARSPRSSNLGLGIGRLGGSDERGQARIDDTHRSTKSPEPHYRSTMSPHPEHDDSLENCIPYKTPAQIMARMADASKSSMPERSLSRRRSLTEKTRSMLGRKLSVKKTSTSNLSGNQASGKTSKTEISTTDLPIQIPFEEHLDRDNTVSPVHLRRRSSQRKHHAMSMSTYSESPVSQMRPNDTPPLREASPQHTQNGVPVPAQNSYGSLSLLPSQPTFSPIRTSFAAADTPTIMGLATKNADTTKPEKESIVPLSKPDIAPDESEGTNASHPLLREERHARFATRMTPSIPGFRSPADLPLRHYRSQADFTHSNPDLTQRQPGAFKAPRRSSSLLYTPDNRITQATAKNLSPIVQRSPSSDQATPNASAINLAPRTNNLPPQDQLGIHPAHRAPEPASASTMAPSPESSSSSSSSSSTTEQGATPPPISTGPSHPNSPPSRFAQLSASRTQSPNTAQSPQHNIHIPTTEESTNDSQATQSADPKQTPFYLNPASSTALVDFLATTPPPSPPRGAANMRSDTPQTTTSTIGFFNKTFSSNRANDTASPPPPAPGRLHNMAPWSASVNDLSNGKPNGVDKGAQRKGLGWKKVFGGSRAPKERKEKEKGGKRRLNWGKDTTAEGLDSVDFANGKATDREKEKDGGFMGVGKDGVWISRKNFVRN